MHMRALAVGMREGGWRRVYVPDAYGDAGLRKVSRGPQGRYTGAKAPFVVQPHAPAYVDLLMFDGGSGRCERGHRRLLGQREVRRDAPRGDLDL